MGHRCTPGADAHARVWCVLIQKHCRILSPNIGIHYHCSNGKPQPHPRSSGTPYSEPPGRHVAGALCAPWPDVYTDNGKSPYGGHTVYRFQPSGVM
eukprot:10908676-Karenia_brevis.AAC.1